MPSPKMCALLALSCCGALPACSTEHLNPLPSPGPAPVVEVPVLVRIPIGLTEPCAKPAARHIETDIDLLEAADAFKVWGQCNANKLRAIRNLSPAAG